MSDPHILLPAAIIKGGEADWGYVRVTQDKNKQVTSVELKAMGRDQMPQDWTPLISIIIVNGRVSFHLHGLRKGTIDASGTITTESPVHVGTAQPVRDATDLRTTTLGEDPPGVGRRSPPRPIE